MDILRADALTTGHRIKLSTPIPNHPGEQFAIIKRVTEVSKGVRCPIVKIEFERTSFSLMANGDREFEVETTTPSPLHRL